MSFTPQKELKKLPKNSEGYVEVLVDTSRVERVIGELNKKFDLTPVVDLENLSRVNFENLAGKYDQLVKSSNLLNENYGKIIPLLSQALDRIQGLEGKIDKFSADNTLMGAMASSLDRLPSSFFKTPETVEKFPVKPKKAKK